MKRIGIVIVSLILIFAMTITSASAAAKPGKVKVTKKTATAKSVTLQWKKAKNAKKYEIQQQKAKKFKKIKTVKKTKVVIKKLKANTKYKFRIRAIKGKKKGQFTKVTVRTKRTKNSSKAVVNNNNNYSPIVTPTKPNSRTPKNHSHTWDTYYQSSSTQHQVYCSGCWDYKLENHKMGKWIVTTPAVSYDPYSYESRYCSLCGYEETRRVYVSNPGSYNPNPGGGDDDNGFTEEPDENDIAFRLPNDFELYTGDIKQVTPDFNISSSDVEYSSSNPNIAAVDSNGYITGKNKGTATITATYKKDRSISDSCQVTVKDMTISLSDYSVNLKALPKGCPETYSNDWKKTITVNKTGIDDRTVYVRSADTNIARCKNNQVNSNNQFEVQAVGSGETTIEVYVKAKKTYSNGGETTVDNKVLKTLTVKNTLLDVPVKDFSANIPRRSLWIGQKPSSEYIYQNPVENQAARTTKINIETTPYYATNWDVVSYTSNDTSILTVDSQGNLTPVKEGKTTITAKIRSCDGNIITKTSLPIEVDKLSFFKEGLQDFIEGGALKDGYQQITSYRANEDNWWYYRRDGSIMYLKNTEGYSTLTKPLTRNVWLENKAKQRAKETWYMKFNEDGSWKSGYQAHTRPDGSEWYTVFTPEERNQYYPSQYKENLSYGTLSGRTMVDSFDERYADYSGQGHRRSMLNTWWTDIGIGCYYHNGKTVWCVMYLENVKH